MRFPPPLALNLNFFVICDVHLRRRSPPFPPLTQSIRLIFTHHPPPPKHRVALLTGIITGGLAALWTYAATAGNQVTSDAFGPVYNDNTIVIVMVGLLGLIIGMVVCSVRFTPVVCTPVAAVFRCPSPRSI